jgi:hypothetical protein
MKTDQRLIAAEQRGWLYPVRGPVGPAAQFSRQIYLRVMRFYFAARFSKRFALRQFRQQLEALGHIVTSRWLDAEGEDPGALGRCAAEDLIDVVTCDTLVNFTEEPRCNSRGARHCEFGIGLALNKRLVIVGPREHAFHFLPQVECFASWADFLGCQRLVKA